MTRREEREQAFILTFEKMFTDESLAQIVEKAMQVRDVEIGPYALKAADGVIEQRDALDGVVEKYLKRWSKKRISKVSLCVLRLAIYELLNEKDIPQAAVINEAVDLTKKYSTQEDAAFVNGVLGSFVKDEKHDDAGD
ncbi:MAG TPA: transcription antitermination factor NusB [Ruminococcaceae bacterium]|nr:transcription antitermination factor NusB [Oscillospiraceae bacterium]